MFLVDFETAVAGFKSAVGFSAVTGATMLPARSSDLLPPPYSLDDLLGLAAVGNQGLRANLAAEAAAKATLAGARARRLPTLGTKLAGTYIANASEPVQIRKGDIMTVPLELPDKDIVFFEGSGNAQYDFKLTGDLPIYSWGKISLGIDLAKIGMGAAALQADKAALELAVKLRASWDALSSIVKAGEVLEFQARIGARLVVLAEESAAAGFMTPADLAGARMKLKEIEIARTKLAAQRDRLLSGLASMSGLDDLVFEQLEMEAPVAGAPRWSEEEAWSLARNGNYDLALLSTLLASKQELVKLARKESIGLPDIGLHLELSYGGPVFPFLDDAWKDKDDYQLTVTLGASGSIFGNGVKVAEAAKAKADLAEVEARQADAEQSIRAYIRETYLGIDLGKARLEYAALKQDGWAVDLAQMRATIQAGAGSEAEYLSKMMEALGGLAEAYGTLAEYRGALVSLDAVVGAEAGL
jgi:outer membrane protein TolC